MKQLIYINNFLIRILSGFIPFSRLRKKLRENHIYTQFCPKGAEYHLIIQGKDKCTRLIKYGLKLEVFGQNNKIIIDSTARFSKATLVIRGSNNTFRVGKNSDCNNAQFHLYGNNLTLSVGEGCLFSYNTELWTGDGHAIFEKGQAEPYNFGKSVNIGNHVWLGAHAKILKGVNIPNNSVVGMCAVVNKNFVKENTIIAGFPAKVVQENIEWNHTAPEDITKTR